CLSGTARSSTRAWGIAADVCLTLKAPMARELQSRTRPRVLTVSHLLCDVLSQRKSPSPPWSRGQRGLRYCVSSHLTSCPTARLVCRLPCHRSPCRRHSSHKPDQGR